MFDPNKLKEDFPIFKNSDLVYLDNAATTQKPLQVLDDVFNFYTKSNANPHRSAHKLGVMATDLFEKSRIIVKDFINASSENEIVFTKSATESLNLISTVFERSILEENDEVLLTIQEHHSNLVNWQAITQNKNAKLVYAYLDDDLRIDEEDLLKKINKNTKLITLTHASNVTGAVTDIEALSRKIRKLTDAYILVDASQSAPHKKIDVQKMDCDFLVASGHKFLAPMGIGFLYGKYDSLSKLSPFLYGGDMIEYVFEQKCSFLDAPFRFEAGTQNVGGAVGMASAINYLNNLGMENIEKHEKELMDHALEEIRKIEGLSLYTASGEKTGVISFNLENAHPHDIATILDTENIAVRSGHHCAQPLHRYLGRPFSARASFYIYNTHEDVDKLIRGIYKVKEVLKLGTR